MSSGARSHTAPPPEGRKPVNLPRLTEMKAAGEPIAMVTAYDYPSARVAEEAGADVVVAHMGLTTSGTIGAKTAKSLDDSVREVRAIAEACKSRRDDVLVLCHGGPIAEPEHARYILERVPAVDGFYGASSMERLPTEQAIAQRTREFTAVRRR